MKRAALAFVLVAFLVPVVRAQDAPGDGFKWDPHEKRAPVVGDKSFNDESETDKQKVKVSVNGQVVQQKDETTKTSWHLVEETLAVAEGKVTKRRVKVEAWKHEVVDSTTGEDPDTSLQGKTILVEGRGKDRKVTVEGGDEGLSDAAKKFIDEHVAKRKAGADEKPDKSDDEAKEQLFPKEPVADGAEWTPDLKAFVADMPKEMSVDLEKSSAKGKLSNVHVENGTHFGRVEIDITLQLKTFPGTPIPWTKGGKLELHIAADTSLEVQKSHKATTTMVRTLGGRAEQQGQQGLVKLRLDMHTEQKGSEGEVGATKQ